MSSAMIVASSYQTIPAIDPQGSKDIGKLPSIAWIQILISRSGVFHFNMCILVT